MRTKSSFAIVGVLFVTIGLSAPVLADMLADVATGVKAYQRGDNDEAIRYLTKVIEAKEFKREPADGQAQIFNIRSAAWYGKSDYDRAIADLGEAIRLDPKLTVAYGNRANAWYAKNDFARAVADFNEAIRLNPSNPQYFKDRGNAKQKSGDATGAQADFARAQELNPSSAKR